MEGLAEAALGTEKESSSSEEEEVPNPNDRRPDFCLYEPALQWFEVPLNEEDEKKLKTYAAL